MVIMGLRGFSLLTLCGLGLLGGCITINRESPREPVPTSVAATLTALAPTHAPTIPPLPSPTATLDGKPQDYAGTFTYGFEVVSFTPCNSTEAWWLNGEAAAMTELRTRYAALTKTMQPVYVRLRGLASEHGSYGHMGGYQREFYLQDVLEVRAIQADDCH